MTFFTTSRIASSPCGRRSSFVKTALNSALAGTLVLGALGSLQGCVLLLGAGAVGGGLVLTDRRSSGTQVEDEAIELKSGGRVHDVVGDHGHVNVTSYDRVVLITGEVPAQADREAIGKSIGSIENVGSVVNELEVAGNSSLTSRSSDTVITGKVKSTLVDAKDVQSNAIKVVTERGNVYLMGRVTEREATRAADLARSVGGVMKVVRVFEILSEDQLSNLKSN
jgi:osmotically-inducible protein OsmY